MKKLRTILVVFLCCFVFTACEPSGFSYNYDDLSGNVVTIELINYDNPKAKMVADHLSTARHLNFDFGKEEYIATLEEELHEDFLESISGKMILNHVNHFNSPNELCVKISYTNGDFDIVSDSYIGRFDSTGKFKDYMGVFNQQEDRQAVYEYFDVKPE